MMRRSRLLGSRRGVDGMIVINEMVLGKFVGDMVREKRSFSVAGTTTNNEPSLSSVIMAQRSEDRDLVRQLRPRLQPTDSCAARRTLKISRPSNEAQCTVGWLAYCLSGGSDSSLILERQIPQKPSRMWQKLHQKLDGRRERFRRTSNWDLARLCI